MSVTKTTFRNLEHMVPVIIAILAGGLSMRMGRDKSRMRLGRKSLLGHVRGNARELGHPILVLRRDLVPRCGPLGGVFTGLKRSRAKAVLFLACDMPFVSASLLAGLERRLTGRRRAVFASVDGRAGFPFIIRKEAIEIVERQIARKEFSLRALAVALDARVWNVPTAIRCELVNLNSPEEYDAVR